MLQKLNELGASSYGQVLEANLTEEEREKILWKNTAELFGEGF